MNDMDKKIIGYCIMCGEPIYENDKYFVTIYDEVIHDDEVDDYEYEYWNI